MAQRLMARVRELRLARGLSQEAFAERAGLKYKHYQAVEAGRKSNIQFSTLIKMAEGLNLTLSELVDLTAPPSVAAVALKTGPKTTPAKSVRKSPKRRSSVS